MKLRKTAQYVNKIDPKKYDFNKEYLKLIRQ